MNLAHSRIRKKPVEKDDRVLGQRVRGEKMGSPIKRHLSREKILLA